MLSGTSLKSVGTRVGIAMATLGLGIALASPSSAEPRVLEADLNHATVSWSISHGGFSAIRGIFRNITKVEITFDPDDVANSSVVAAVETASLDSNHAYRDNFVRSDKFLDVIQFNEISFVSTKIEKTGDNTGTMTGDLTLHGVTKPVTFNVTYNKTGDHLSGKFKIDGFTATTRIIRSDFDVKAFIPWVADEVDIIIDIEGIHSRQDG
jgi:polyisoprenoid-binding protein YceI